ncbi:hypothetical protein L249_6140 [Ophiocordyceps polyrhachis-furcata BCC 54312]|uniref:DNA polymerase delta subunit 4 n=1 Tax=Ophiocordyceps polyrhachis-furcata BCC 54312 TaxID=1330021 RepID=A0A367LJJ9_9HYPO|nr:hypothetical protein L249_6140 [Ophiocordyceps polyrhachis-furcata BCC 54312]
MPLTRKAAGARGGRRPGSGKAQSTLSFSGRVTKNTVREAKKNITPAAIAKIQPRLQDEDDGVKEEEEEEDDDDDDDDDEGDSQLSQHAEEAATHEPFVPDRTEAEVRAENVNHAQIASYWKEVELQRKAPRVHQQDVDMCEKVLRYFDVSSQYGPCIGISRRKRWLRAHRLGLDPPIEVLAVLVRDEAKGCGARETAKIDGILNSIAVES